MKTRSTTRWLAAAVLSAGQIASVSAGLAQDSQPNIQGLLSALPAPNNTLPDGLTCSTNASPTLATGRDGLFFSLPTDLAEDLSLTSETKAQLKRFAYALQMHETTLVMMPIPTRGIVQRSHLNGLDVRQRSFDPGYASAEFDQLVSDLRDSGIATVDLLQAIAQSNSWSSFYYLRDNLWTTAGARLAADAVTAELKKSDTYVDLQKLTFTTTAMATVQRKDQMALAIQQLCHRSVPGEDDTSYATAKTADVATEAPSALVGSAFSADPAFNFDGFLQQQSGLEFINYAVQGDSPIGSMATFVNSEEFRNRPPTFLVWEIPPGFNLNTAVFQSFRQLIPAVFGACSGDALVASSEPVAVSGQTQLLDLSDKGIAGAGYYLRLAASHPMPNGISVAVTYPNQDADVGALGSFVHEKAADAFYLNLADEFDGSVQSVIVTGDTAGGTVQLTLCKAPEAVGL